MLRTHALYEMAEDLGPDVAQNFARLYLGALDDRLVRLRHALAANDPVDAYTTAVSLYTASWMVGAEAMAEVARSLADASRSLDTHGALGYLPELEGVVPEVVETLGQVISELG